MEWRERVGQEKRAAFRDEEYWAKPVPGFGDANARVVIVGLAPAAHGANRTGRMFTGDGHGAAVELGNGPTLLCSYHPAQQNTFTERVTQEMLDAVFERAKELLSK